MYQLCICTWLRGLVEEYLESSRGEDEVQWYDWDTPRDERKENWFFHSLELKKEKMIHYYLIRSRRWLL